MFARLVQKELLHHLLDFRFTVVFALCVLLSALSAHVGSRNYLRELKEYDTVSQANREELQGWLKKGDDYRLESWGYAWNPRPEILSSVVYGLSGVLGREVKTQVERLPEFEGSSFETDPTYKLFGVLDLALIVKVVLSLCILLVTYDAICGEKEIGTLRLFASFSIPRSTLAVAKLAGSTVTVLIPFILASLLSAVVLALSPSLGMRGGDWVRFILLMGLFGLYLVVFAAFGLWASALTHRRVTAFLGLLVLWTMWLFIVPNVALRAGLSLMPGESVYAVDREVLRMRRDTSAKTQAEITDYIKQNLTGRNWNSMSKDQQRQIQEGIANIMVKWDREYLTSLARIRSERTNHARHRLRLIEALSAISPFGAVSLASMDLARTGLEQQERMENTLNAHLIYYAQFIRGKQAQSARDRVLTDFSPFTYQDRETISECLSRNAFHILNLALLAILGFAGAYVAILRYDVR